MKLKEFGPPGGHASLTPPPLDPPLPLILLITTNYCAKWRNMALEDLTSNGLRAIWKTDQ